MSFLEEFNRHNWDESRVRILEKSERDVETALAKPKGRLNLQDFLALISPAASAYLEEMARRSHALTVERFGRVQQLYAPMYLSNVCSNVCTYCGFSATNRIPRKILSDVEIEREYRAIKELGFDHILLVTGEANRQVGVPYLQNAIRKARDYFSSISIEVQPLHQEEYEVLVPEGLSSVLVYQETYNRSAYADYHLRGMKRDFDFRLETPDRLGRAGIKKIGLGALYGLDDWRTDTFFVALHLKYLERKYWKTRYSISFPRIRPHEGDIHPRSVMGDHDLVQVICAFRLLSQEIELSLSTRESERFRDHLIRLGITTLSAGSKTNPGGYAVDRQSLEQFEISDERTPAEVATMLRSAGYEPIWKDWDSTYDGFQPVKSEDHNKDRLIEVQSN
ncbi:MAG: 2-iminoacetate synthase ThiH [Verrucomicrobiae bacterium]|nr:2-iminoacetate synthase ThiH [Verrucomicrobiae bacterium]